MEDVRIDWTLEEVQEIYFTPLLDLIFKAAGIHRKFFSSRKIQFCTLFSIKTGGCSENCSYCAQSAYYQTEVSAKKLEDQKDVLEAAKQAKEAGSTRFCMGAAWRGPKDGPQFERTLDMVKKVKKLGLEVCCTFGLLSESQAMRLKEAGAYAYNHNLDTGPNFYSKIITTRTFEDRLETIRHVQNAGMTVCSGGIIGMGETDQDRMELLHVLATLKRHPESVPINALVPIKGTPLENQKLVTLWEFVRMIATARILMPKSMVRLSAGRKEFNAAEHALCFLAGANSIFTGDKLLTAPNQAWEEDQRLLKLLNLEPAMAKEELLLMKRVIE